MHRSGTMIYLLLLRINLESCSSLTCVFAYGNLPNVITVVSERFGACAEIPENSEKSKKSDFSYIHCLPAPYTHLTILYARIRGGGL